jgi:3-oxoacyl-[acyl-carrier-protein] synthase II
MIVAAGGGERDGATDEAIMAGLATAPDRGRFLNERLSNDLRPTLFLAQLSNLLAGNISIVHGVVGSSRTFMGEEAAGTEALRIGAARIGAGQGDLFLVGGAYNAERKDMLLLHALGHAHLKGEWTPVWSRGAKGGMATGSLGAFLVLEARDHAEARGARPLARLAGVASTRTGRIHGAATEAGLNLWQQLSPNGGDGATAVLSGASGVEPVTREERAFLEAVLPEAAVRGTGTMLGHGIEAQFAANVGLAALALSRGGFYPPFDESGVERPAPMPPRQILVTGFGHWRGEGLALVAAAG